MTRLKNPLHYLLLALIAIHLAPKNYSQDKKEHFLRIDPIGHMGQIRDLVVSKDERYFITAGFDKTIKRWDISTGRIVMEYRGQIGVGSEGMVYHIALSPDNKYVASMGWFGSTDETEPLGDVRIYDYVTGKLIRVLKGLNSSPAGLGFSNDSKYIIAGDANSDIFKWEIASGKKVASYQYHSPNYDESLFSIVVENDRMLSIDWKGHCCLWDINSPTKPLKIEKKFIKKALYNDIGPLAIAPTLDQFAVSLNGFIIIFDEKMKYKQHIQRVNHPGFLQFSPDGNRLYCGSVTSGEENRFCSVFQKNAKGSFEEIVQYKGHDNTVLAGAILSDNRFLSAGGEHDEIHFWEANNSSPVLIQEFVGTGKSIYASSLNNQMMGFTNAWTANLGKSDLLEKFDLFLKEYSKVESSDKFSKPEQNWNDFDLTTYNSGGGVSIFSDLIIQKKKKNQDTIHREYWDGSRHNTFTFTPNGFVVSGGSYGVLQAYDTNGVMVNEFIGHEGDIWGTSISVDKNRLITCGSDKTIRIWNLEKVGIQNSNQPPKSVREVMDELEVGIDQTVYKQIFQQLGIYKLADDRAYVSWEKIIKTMKANDYPVSFLENRLNYYKSTIIYPTLSMFFTDDNEWIIWNEEGYFTSSKNGAKYVGYHVNKGQDKEAKFYPFEQFDLKYNRPDIILKDLEIGHEKIIDFYYKSYLKRLKKHNLNIEDLQKEINAPELTITGQKKVDQSDHLQVSFQAVDNSYSIEKVMVHINGVPIYGKTGKTLTPEKKVNETLDIELAKGVNNIEISVLNEKGVESLKEYVTIENGVIVEKPNLYILAIGTSKYKDSKFDLKYAAKDAGDFAKTFENDPVYNQVYTKVLVDAEVTANNLLGAKNFLGQAGRNDVVMVFVAGHGLLDNNYDYYYASHDVNFQYPGDKGIPYENLEALLEGIRPLKKLLIMDTCHSGEVDSEEVEETMASNTEEAGDVTFRSVGTTYVSKNEGATLQNTSELMKELFVDIRRGTGATVISSAGGLEFAMESDQWKNGLFTYCLLKGIQSKEADLDHDGTIVLSELKEFVQEEVTTLSHGRQTPTSRIENPALDFNIWK